PAPVGNGFTITPGDLLFILKQIKIAERHSQAIEHTGTPPLPSNPDPTNDPQYCSSLIGPADNQIPDYLTSYGLRTVDGGCNNLVPSALLNPNGSTVHNAQTGAVVTKYASAQADQPFPRLTTPNFRDADEGTSYDQTLAGNVVIDSQPRTISNLIVDQTATNPAAIAAAEFPVRTQGNAGIHPCTTDPDPLASPPTPGIPAGCTPAHQTLFIPNVTTDVGLSPPYNSLFTFFGQFFDHGVDQTVKSGGTVIVPLKDDDPLIAGADHIFGNADDLAPELRFMALTRAQNQPGPDGILGTGDDVTDANNTDTPWVDQSQTYTSHSAHQVFLREYDMIAGPDNVVGTNDDEPVATGKLLGGIATDDPACADSSQCYNDGNATDGSISTWAATRKQAATKLGLLLQDKDVTNIPMILADPYGNFIRGQHGLPQYVTKDPSSPTGTALVEGDLANPVPVPDNVLYFDTPFLTDIAHNADPSPVDDDHDATTPPVAPVPDGDNTTNSDFASQPIGTYDDELLNDHFTCGDGRCNENIALSTIHQVFHHEHDRLVGDVGTTLAVPANKALSDDFHATNCAVGCAGFDPGLPITYTYGERLFQAARFVTEMEYQHLVFEEFARKIQPAVRPFHLYTPDLNPGIPAEFAAAVYRFGHSMLDNDVARTTTNADGSTTDNSLPLLEAFLNPPEYFNNGEGGTYTPEQAAGAIVMGSADQVGNELDEFVTETLRNNLLGLPLDLATLNMTRARDVGIPPLNDVRRQIFARTNDGQLAPYTSWSDYGQHLKHPESLINFIAAYGTHPTITGATTLTAKRDAARAIVDPQLGDVPPPDAADFMF
ncbi:MAG TPA: peroxidase family protein, partial [Ilumatobacteraceae bacterium]|nr:peroxidase family protein [Ilumatobacteraceae bacterium]